MSRTLSILTITATIGLFVALAGALAGTASSGPAPAPKHSVPLGTAFTYQGHLTEGANPADGAYDFSFSLYDDPTAGNQVGSTQDLNDVPVADGLFSVELDFGSVFGDTALWLEIGVRPGDEVGEYDILSPRQRLTPAPFAAYASGAPWAGLTGIPSGFDDQVDDDTLAQLSCETTGQIAEWNGTAWVCGDDDVGSGGASWLLTGNTGTVPGTNYLGTTDNVALELRVDGERAWRLEPKATSPNIVGGYAGNSVDAGTDGATIGGGGRDLAINQANGSYSTVGGGAGNSAGGYASAVGGGEGNSASGSYSTAGGGEGNAASGSRATVGGGEGNTASGSRATVGGGSSNSVGGYAATVGGGASNVVTGTYGTVGGGLYNSVAAAYGTIAGGGPSDTGNLATTNNRVYDEYGTVGGGGENVAGYDDDGDPTLQPFATVGGGEGNTASGGRATVGGGSSNSARGYAATVGGGASNVVTGTYGTVGGGAGNSATNTYATIGGGTGNEANGSRAVIAGGSNNSAASGYATIGGGFGNTVTGTYGTIPGGAQNYVGANYGFAAGQGARAEHQGAFVWSGSTGTFTSTAPSQFLIDAPGGVGIGTNSPSHMLTVEGSASIQRGVGIGTDSPSHLLTVEGSAAIRSSAVISVGAIISYPFTIQAPRALYAVGDLLYAAGYATNTLSIWNVTDPQNHTLIGYTTFQLGGPVDLQVVGDRAYLASQNRDMLTILDVSDPSDPSHVGDTTEYLDHPQGVHLSGKYAYVASMGSGGRYDGLTVFDVTDAPAEMAATSFITTHLQLTSDVFVVDNYAYVTSSGNNRLVVFDVSDPRHPLPVSYTDQSLSEPVRLHVSGIYAYVVAEGTDTLEVFDVSNPAQIAHVEQVWTGLTHPRSLYVSGDRAYVAYAGDASTSEKCGLAVLDISDPADIAVLNVIDMSDWLEELVPPKPVAVTGSGARVYVANERHDSVTVFEIDGLEASAVRTGELQVARLEVDDYAAIEGDLGVLGGLNVGPGGALIQGALTIEAEGDSYIRGRLGIGPVATVITRSVSPTETEEIVMRHPTHQLDVDGEARFRVNEHNHLLLRSANVGSDEDAYIDFVHFDYTGLLTPTARIEFDAADPVTHSTSMRFYTQGPGDGSMRERLRIDDEGDLLPALNGAYSLGSSDLRWADVWTVGGLHQLSDARHKETVSALPYGLEEVAALRPVTFSWIEDPDKGLHYGLIAQEVREVLPEVVSRSEGEDGTLSMDYGELVPVLVKAVQEQQEQIEAQAGQLAALEARLAALESAQAPQPGWLDKLSPLGLGGLGLVLGALVLVRRWRPGGLS